MRSKSPFPGMDPYLEPHWEDVHQSLATYARDQLQGQLPNDLYAHLQERIYLAGEQGPGRSMYPDVRVSESDLVEAGGGTAVAVETDVAEALEIEVLDEPVSETFIEIRDATIDNRIITVIEFLSPANKRRGPGRTLYLKKQEELKAGQVSLVEIDLIREGEYTLALPRQHCPSAAWDGYRACVWRSWKPTRYRIYPLPLNKTLPILPIPLRPTDRAVRLNLQAILDQAYQNGRYGGLLNYRRDPHPPLEPEEAAWAQELLRREGLRE